MDIKVTKNDGVLLDRVRYKKRKSSQNKGRLIMERSMNRLKHSEDQSVYTDVYMMVKDFKAVDF